MVRSDREFLNQMIDAGSGKGFICLGGDDAFKFEEGA
jgi:hypothetical protein